MEDDVIEGNYPITFRKKDAEILGLHLKNRESVVLVGIKRVGINNFLKFFLHNKKIAKTYIDKNDLHLFIPIDLNDLVEREVFPFWILTLKRICDAVEESSLSNSTKAYIENLFLDSIQSKDIFLTIESIKKSLLRITHDKVFPTIFFIRFDRLKDIVTSELFGNLQGLRDSANQKLSFVFTSYRSLDFLAPNVFTKSSLSVFSRNMYIKPAQSEDVKIIFNSYGQKHKLSLEKSLENSLLEIVDGYVQYLQLALIILHEKELKIKNKNEILDTLLKDERITLQSEEVWESLRETEKNVLLKVNKKEKISNEDQKQASYLWDTGLVARKGERDVLFSPLFVFYLNKVGAYENQNDVNLSKKEHLLFVFLNDNKGKICEREDIIKAVWSEVEELGVSDWAIDRLIARLRSKLKSQKAKYEIQTVKTRGYKMIEA